MFHPWNLIFYYPEFPLLHPPSSITMVSTNAQPEPYPQPSSNLWGKQICISGLDTAHRQFVITTKYKFQDQWMLIPPIKIHNLFIYFIHHNWSITYGKYSRPTGTLTTTLLKPTGQANEYVWFGYGPQKIFKNNIGQVSGSINIHLRNTKAL